jgi:hypothetical protein
MAAYEQKASLLTHDFQEHDHRQFIEKELTGIDVMPFAAHLAVIQLALKNPVFWTDLVRVAVLDSTDSEVEPGKWVSSLHSMMPKGQAKLTVFATGNPDEMKVRKGALSPSGAGRGFQLEPVDVVIMNPPFTKKQFINKDFRATLTQNFSDYKNYINNEQSYWSYFVLLADRFLKPGGRLALVLPASILRQPTFAGLRRLLLEKYSIRFVITTNYRSAFSESASFREVLLVAEKDKQEEIPASFVTLKVLPNAQNIDSISTILLDPKKDSLAEYGECKYIVAQQLNTRNDWFSFLPGEEQRLLVELASSARLSPLARVVPDMIQGLRLNRQETEMRPQNAMLSYEREERTQIDWKITQEDKESVCAFNTKRAIELKFPKAVLIPSTRTATGMDKMLIDRNYDYVVVNRFKGDESFWDQENISGILKGRLEQIETRSAYLIVAGRGGLNLAAGGTKLLAFCSRKPIAPTWAFWSLRTRSFEDACLLVLWWNSTYMLNQLIDVRTEVEGARVWFGKSALEPLSVIDPNKLTKASEAKLLKVFSELSQLQFPSILEQLETKFKGRVKIDQELAKSLDIEEYTDLDSLAKLYDDTSTKLKSLKSMMGRR